MSNPTITRSNFTIRVNKNGTLLQSTKPITVKNQIEEIRSIDNIPGVNTAFKTDGATLVYNANTNEYDVKLYNYDDYLNVSNLYIQHLYANNSLGSSGQVLTTNGNTIYWANDSTSVIAGTGLTGGGSGTNITLSVNADYIATLTANNTTFAFGKRESDLIVNFATFAGDANFAYIANNTTFAFGKAENQLDVNSANSASYSNIANFAYIANNTTYAYGKLESDLIVNFATFAGDANFAYIANNATYAYDKQENQLNVNAASYSNITNYAFVANSALNLDGGIIDCGTY